MKRSSKKLVITLVIVFSMTLSMFAYPFLSIFREGQKNKITEIDDFIIKGNISDEVKSNYLQMGITFLTLVYDENIPNETISFVEKIPSRFTTSYGEIQIIILQIPGNENYIILESINSEKRINVTDDIVGTLCEVLVYPAIECAISAK